MNPGSVPISCSCKHSIGDRRATADTTQRLFATDGMLKGEGSEEERVEEAEETAVRWRPLQGRFIRKLQGSHKNGGQEMMEN